MSTSRFASIIKENIKNYNKKILKSEEGIVISIGDSIIIASGLKNVMLNEIVEFENGVTGLVQNLEEDVVAIISLGKFENIKEGSIVKRTHQVSKIKVGDGFLGRIVDALGNPIDGKGPIKGKMEYHDLEKIAPGVMTRKSVDQPMQTGILAIDSMFPIGKGQRELIIGDRQTGKTTVALDTIINQKGKNVYCIYVSIGQKTSSVANVMNILSEAKANEYTTIVSSPANDFPSLNYLAPFTGISLAEYWMSQGKDVLIVYDDLSKHAIAYRTISLLLRRPPGREAFPGDIFYLHSRLLERSCRLNEKNGGGSITALPIIETLSGDISAYIPTNVISITDGQLFMQANLFNSGQRPAIDVGLSVSRVGSAAQIKCIKQASSSLKLELASYNELQSFAQFGSDLDKETTKALNHGKRIMELLKQRQSSPIHVIDETIILFLIKEKFIDFIPVENVIDFKLDLIRAANNWKSKSILSKTKNIDENTEKVLRYEIKNFIFYYINQISDYHYPIGLSKDDLQPTNEEKGAYKKVDNISYTNQSAVNDNKPPLKSDIKSKEKKQSQKEKTLNKNKPANTKVKTIPPKKKHEISKDQKHTIVKLKDANDYNYKRRLSDWLKNAGYNPQDRRCSICHNDCNTSILLENNKHICYTCWIKKSNFKKISKSK